MIQIDKTMPQNCYDCPCTNDGFYRCLLADKQLEDDCEDSRPTWCPLHEVTDSDTISRRQTLEHLKKRLYESALNNDGIASYTFEEIADNRIQIWMDELPPSPSRPKWIPCSNRLPEVTVLCCDTRGEMIIGYPYQDEESNTGYGAVLDDVVMIDCTAWMPLPEPYRP